MSHHHHHHPKLSSRSHSYNSPSTPTPTTTPDPLDLVPPSSSNNTGGRSSSKMVAIKVLLLDDTVTIIQAQPKSPSRLIFDQICKQLNILEADYFGLCYSAPPCGDREGVGATYWLDLDKRLNRQVNLNLSDNPVLKFSVKFYTPDPSQLEEEFTRYLFSLQIKRDLATGVLICNDNTAALMASFIVQAECGDFNEEDYPDASYLSVFKFVPHQNSDLERKIRECHKKHVGQSPAEADLHLLETARRTEMYGVRIVNVKDEDGVSLGLSVLHNGVVVFQNGSKINNFSWAKIRKISFKRKRFIVKLHPETYGYYRELVEFIFESRNECKGFWKRCVEHHAFFRCEKAPNPMNRSKSILSSRGSSFRYSGRTQKQMVQFVRENFVKRPSQYMSQSQQNLSSAGGEEIRVTVQRGRSAEFTRSSSLKSNKSPSSNNHRNHVTHRSTGQLNYDDEDDDEEEDEEDEEDFINDYNVQPIHHPHHHPQHISPTQSSATSSPGGIGGVGPISSAVGIGANNSIETPYTLTHLLLTTFKTHLTDLEILSSTLSIPVIQSLLLSAQTLSKSILALLKPHFEHPRTPLELSNRIMKLKRNYSHYLNYVKLNYGKLITQDGGGNGYLGMSDLLMKPLLFLELFSDWRVRLKLPLDKDLQELLTSSREFRSDAINEATNVEITRDIVNLPALGKSRFLLMGVLQKLNRNNGSQMQTSSRLFLLFTDYLIYCTRISSLIGFRLHGVIRMKDIGEIENNSGENNSSFVLNVFDNNNERKVLVLSAANQKDRDLWLQSLKKATKSSQISNGDGPSLKITSLSTEDFQVPQQFPNSSGATVPIWKPNLHTHVVWHRNLTISADYFLESSKYQISSYLLRKFKSSPGWQRLWVVYCNLCLYFYKNDEELKPLASLPLLGYKVGLEDGELQLGNNKGKNVFKLEYKNHVYWFRAGNENEVKEWVTVLRKSLF